MNKAFTLIELLVVIAIIAILAATLFPAFAQAKMAAKKSVDMMNMRQMAYAVNMYAGDNDDTLPQNDYEQSANGSTEQAQFPETYNPQNPTGNFQIGWTYMIRPYCPSWDVFYNPADQNPFPSDTACTDPNDIGKLDVNGHMFCDWEAPKSSYIPIYNAMPAHDWTVVNMSQFPDVTNQIVVSTHRNNEIAGDGHKGTSGYFPSQPCPQLSIVPLPASATTTSPHAAANSYSYFTQAAAQAELALALPNFHASWKPFKNYDILRVHFDLYNNAGANYSFADGHAKYEPLGKTLDPNHYQYGTRWIPNSQPWNSSPCQ